MKKPKTIKKLSLKKLKEKADSIFAKETMQHFITEYHVKQCYMCGSENERCIGHILNKKGAFSLRYVKKNAVILCKTCNFKDWKNPNFRAKFINKIDQINGYVQVSGLLDYLDWKEQEFKTEKQQRDYIYKLYPQLIPTPKVKKKLDK